MTIDHRDAATAGGTTTAGAPRESDSGRDVARPASGSDPHRFRATAVVVGTYVALAVVLYWQVWSQGIGSHLQIGGDQFANVWYLRWTPFALLHGSNPLFSSYANYPYGVNMVTNTSAPLLGLLGMPLTLVAGSIATFNVLSTLALAGSATAGYVFARRFTSWRPAAWVGGLLYGFSPFEIGQATGGHLNLTFVVLPPLILLGVHEVTVRQRWSPRRAGVVLGLLVTAQFFISSEILASTVVMGGVCVLVAALSGWRTVGAHLRAAVLGAAWTAGVAVVLLAYPVWFAVRGPGSISGPIQLVPQAYRADILGLVYPGAYMWIAPSSLTRTSSVFANSIVENGSYLGVTLLVTVLGAVIALWRRSPTIRVAAVGGVVAWVLSLGSAPVVRSAPGAAVTGFPLPERLFTHLPLLVNTVPVRYSLYVALFASLILAVALDRLHTRMSERASITWLRSRVGSVVVPATLAVICLVPLIPSLPIEGIGDPDVPAYFSSAALQRIPSGSVALLYPYPSSPTPQGQLWQAETNFHFKMPGGYFLVPQSPQRTIAFNPAVGYDTYTLTSRTLIGLAAGTPPAETPALRAALVAQLRGWHVRTMVASMTGVTAPAQSVQFLSWLAGEPPTPDHGVLAWYGVFG